MLASTVVLVLYHYHATHVLPLRAVLAYAMNHPDIVDMSVVKHNETSIDFALGRRGEGAKGRRGEGTKGRRVLTPQTHSHSHMHTLTRIQPAIPPPYEKRNSCSHFMCALHSAVRIRRAALFG